MAGVSRIEGPRLGGPAAAATARYLRVLLNSSGQWAIAGDVEADGECDTENVAAAGDRMICYSKNEPGTHIYVAVKAIAIGDVCSSVAAGKVTDAAGVAVVCRAVTAAAADGDYFEGIPMTGNQDTDT